ncbi:DinB family protein [Deinococcus lacus]|uniref:DinB family protein n=1 Tax=Deinococcus lacus TaxID=392561 RepID=A0ABW1YD28_9DEIO
MEWKDAAHWISDWKDALDEWQDEGQDESSSSGSALPLLVGAAAIGGLYWLFKTRREDVKGLFVEHVLERPAQNMSYLQLESALEAGQAALDRRVSRAADTEVNRELVRHIIGIERWGRARLQSAVRHRPWVVDGHQDYKPPTDLSLSELQTLLAEQRRKTAEFAHSLHQAPPQGDQRILHNGLGPLTIKAWLRYLAGHAELESHKLLPV